MLKSSQVILLASQELQSTVSHWLVVVVMKGIAFSLAVLMCLPADALTCTLHVWKEKLRVVHCLTQTLLISAHIKEKKYTSPKKLNQSIQMKCYQNEETFFDNILFLLLSSVSFLSAIYFSCHGS